MRREFDPQLGVALAGGQHLVDAGEAFDVVLDAAGRHAQTLVCGRAGEQHHCRGKTVRRGELLHVGFAGVVRQIAVVLVLHQPAQIGHMLVELAFRHLAETHQDHRGIVAAGARHKADIGQGTNRLLQRFGHLLLDILGGRAGQHRVHHQPVEVDLGVLLAWQAEIPQHAEQQHDHEADVRQRVVGDEAGVETHRGLSAR